MTTFVQDIAAAQTRWDAAVVLLKRWSTRPAGIEPARDGDDFLDLVDEVRQHFDGHPRELELTDADRSFIINRTEAGADLHKVDAVGFGLNLAASAGFAYCWRERLGVARFRPSAGDVLPVADAPWPRELGAAARTPSPRSMGIDGDDHPYARTFRADALPVEFDFTLWRALRRIGLNLDALAAVTVNESLDELGLDQPRPVAFPVMPADRAQQERAVLEQLDTAIDAGARVVLFPELSTSPRIVEQIKARLAAEDDELLVICGSWHEVDPESGAASNMSVGLVSGLDHQMQHRKIIEFGNLFPKDPGDRRREGIQAPESPLLRVYVADQFRFALTICKDFLDRDVAATLDLVGPNVLLVPALSRTLQRFEARAAAHIADAQAMSLVANGPRTWEGEPVEPTAFLARPYAPGHVVAALAAQAASTLLFSLRTGSVRAVRSASATPGGTT